jgi:ElaB/YqjD/DUF883 family membrane-anchored ribosome-binding protein
MTGQLGNLHSEESDMQTSSTRSQSASPSTGGGLSNAASDALGQAQAAAQEQYDQLTMAIRRNPLQAAGIAAGIGFLLALLARR